VTTSLRGELEGVFPNLSPLVVRIGDAILVFNVL
jgi:hypothetical protein